MDQEIEFNFKPINEGLGFHHKEVKKQEPIREVPQIVWPKQKIVEKKKDIPLLSSKKKMQGIILDSILICFFMITFLFLIFALLKIDYFQFKEILIEDYKSCALLALSTFFLSSPLMIFIWTQKLLFLGKFSKGYKDSWSKNSLYLTSFLPGTMFLIIITLLLVIKT